VTQEHHVAIVSFEGALKREIKRIRNELKNCEDFAHMIFKIEADGNVNSGNIKLTYQLCGPKAVVTGDSIQAVLDECLRRHGWEKIHAPKALSYERIPSDDMEEETDDGVPF